MSAKSFELRPATAEDADAFGRIKHQWSTAAPWMPDLHEMAGTQRFAARVIREERVFTDMAGRGFVAIDGDEVSQLYVDASARGQGLGAALLDKAKEGADRLELWCFQANIDAQRFYHTHGFTELRRTDGQSNDEKLPDIRMGWARHD